jgi:biopolymer transport protein ExbD
MAGVDLEGPSRAKKTGLRRPKRRIAVRIDMTPMVDIAFLLLIFYMVTTLFSAPKAMEISLPPDKEKEVEIKESNLLFLRVTSEGKIYHNFGIKGTPELIKLDSLRAFLFEKTKQKPDDIVLFVKMDKEAKYSTMVDIIDEIQVVESKMKETLPDFSSRFSIDTLDNFDRKALSNVLRAAEVSGGR